MNLEISPSELTYQYLPAQLRSSLGNEACVHSHDIAETLIKMLDTDPKNVRQYLDIMLGTPEQITEQKLTELIIHTWLHYGNNAVQAVFCLLEAAYTDQPTVSSLIEKVRLSLNEYYNMVVESGDIARIVLPSGAQLSDMVLSWQRSAGTWEISEHTPEVLRQVLASIFRSSTTSPEAWLLYLAGLNPGSWEYVYPVAHQILDSLTRPTDQELKPLLHIGRTNTGLTADIILDEVHSGSFDTYAALIEHYTRHATEFENTEQVLSYAQWLQHIIIQLREQLDQHIPSWSSLPENQFKMRLQTSHLRDKIVHQVKVVVPNFMYYVHSLKSEQTH